MVNLSSARTLLILIFVIAGFIFFMNFSKLKFSMQEPHIATDRPNGEGLFRVTKESKAYNVNHQISCFFKGCGAQNNKMAHAPCSQEANEWNFLGVSSMNRHLNGDINGLQGYNGVFLLEALRYFKKAHALDPECPNLAMNLAMIHIGESAFDEAVPLLEKALALYKDNSDKAVVEVMLGLAHDYLKDGSDIDHYTNVKVLDPNVAIKYFGIHYEPFKMGKGDRPELKTLALCAMWQYFSDISFAEYGLLQPGTQDFFIENRYIVLRKLVPPFVLNAVSSGYRDAVKRMKLNDGQSKRYYEHNGRVARYLQFQLTDYIRKVIAHNARPTYTYFGGYIPGADLKPHIDREQCEFTMSLTIEQFPHDQAWLLSLGKKPLFDRGSPPAGTRVEYPPEEEIVDAELYAGDALLFMGRHLVHFRRGSLPKGRWLNQIFFHYVQENFGGELN